jgi:hypothetical protein
LGGVFITEAAFKQEWEQFTSDLAVTGFSPSGQLKYVVGFAAADALAAPPNYVGTLIVPANFSTGVLAVCPAATCLNVAKTVAGAALATVAGSVSPAGLGNAAAYTMVANGGIGGAALDTWTMTQAKVFANTIDGIP